AKSGGIIACGKVMSDLQPFCRWGWFPKGFRDLWFQDSKGMYIDEFEPIAPFGLDLGGHFRDRLAIARQHKRQRVRGRRDECLDPLDSTETFGQHIPLRTPFARFLRDGAELLHIEGNVLIWQLTEHFRQVLLKPFCAVSVASMDEILAVELSLGCGNLTRTQQLCDAFRETGVAIIEID